MRVRPIPPRPPAARRQILGWFVLGVLGLAAAAATPASAATLYGFTVIPPADSAATAVSQYAVSVDGSGTSASFTFTNNGPLASSIEAIYFDNGTSLTSFASLGQNGTTVNFSQQIPPPALSLPRGNSIGFTEAFGFQAAPPPSQNGLNPGESVTVNFNVTSLASVLNELQNGSLKIGIHVIGFTGGQSESFVNTPAVPVPPAAAGGLGLLGLAEAGRWLRRRRQASGGAAFA